MSAVTRGAHGLYRAAAVAWSSPARVRSVAAAVAPVAVLTAAAFAKNWIAPPSADNFTLTHFRSALVDDQEPPEAEHRDVSFPKLLVANAIQGALFRAVRAGTDRGTRLSFYRATGTWPGEEEPDTARAYAEELASIAETYGTSALKAQAAFTRGQVALALGESDAAFHAYRQARTTWDSTGAT
jgi:hypothetical protein